MAEYKEPKLDKAGAKALQKMWNANMTKKTSTKSNGNNTGSKKK